jgi:hypothetical protein
VTSRPIALPDGAADPRSGETALAMALGGALCPVPFVMSAAAMRIARPRRTRRARIAYWLAAATIALQAVGVAALALTLTI